VLGLRLGSSPEQGKTELESLFQHHYFSSSGFSLLPQGAPTNNTEEQNSAQSRGDDPDASYDFVFNGKAQFTETDEVLDKSDGQWLAESLGLDTEWLKQIPHAGGTDQSEARAMNTVLWPATLGYFMDTLLQPVFDDDAVYHTRWFFNRYVSGRGMVPAIRVGRQPYGILPTTAFGKIRWTEGEQRVPLAGHSALPREAQQRFRPVVGEVQEGPRRVARHLDRQGAWRFARRSGCGRPACRAARHRGSASRVGRIPPALRANQGAGAQHRAAVPGIPVVADIAGERTAQPGVRRADFVWVIPIRRSRSCSIFSGRCFRTA
jgi:hypothetical protein